MTKRKTSKRKKSPNNKNISYEDMEKMLELAEEKYKLLDLVTKRLIQIEYELLELGENIDNFNNDNDSTIKKR